MTTTRNPPMTPGEKRAYMRACNRRRSEMIDVRAKAADEIAAVQASLNAALRGKVGPCSGCRFWSRGGTLVSPCKWGQCAQPEWPRPWASDGDNNRTIYTHEHFGCVNYAPSAPTAAADCKLPTCGPDDPQAQAGMAAAAREHGR